MGHSVEIRMLETFEQLLDRKPELRNRRNISSSVLREHFDRPDKHCTWCGKKVEGRRQTWCSSECVTEYRERCDSQYAAYQAHKRDQGICQICGRDTGRCQRIYRAFCRSMRLGFSRDNEITRWLKSQMGFGRGRWGEVDHVVPVCEGGGLCTLDGLRWLCGACHAEETRELAARRAKKPVPDGQLELF